MKKYIILFGDIPVFPIYKSLVIMKIAIILLLIASLHVTAKTNAQNITLVKNNISLADVFREFKKQSNYNIISNAELLKRGANIRVEIKNKPLKDALNTILGPLNLDYTFKGKTIVVFEANNSDSNVNLLENSSSTVIQQITLTGVVRDDIGQLLAGVSVQNTRSKIQVKTNEQGEFSLSVLKGDQISFSYLGYRKVDLVVGDNLNVSVVMIQAETDIDEIVVVGYGTVQKRDLTGAVSQVKMKDINEVPVIRVDQMLQGRIAGAEVVSTTGEPGANTSIRIRGTRSISANNEPLYVVDGVIDAITDLNDISPNDVTLIEVLKDVSSTAIYGSRGSNGVIIITTKSGAEGSKPIFNFRSELGTAALPKNLDIMNAQEFVQLQNDWFYISNVNNQTKPMEEYPYPDPLSLGEGTNWTDVITRNAPYTNLVLSGSGGNKNTKYYFSGNYNNTQGIIINSGIKRYQTRVNLDKTFSKYVKTGFKLNYAFLDQDLNNAEVGNVNYWYRNTLFLTPLMEPYKEDGSFNDWNPLQYEGQIFDSPLAMAELMKRNMQRKTLNLISYIEIEPIKSLKLRSQVSYYDYNRFSNNFTPGSLPTRANKGSGAYAYKGAYKNNNILSENTITYAKSWENKHFVDGLYGFSYQQFWNSNMTMSGEGYFIDDLEENNMGAIPSKETISLGSNLQKQIKLSNFVRFNYNYNRKYYLTLTTRADASSNFSANNKWGYFPSGAIKWSASNEEFLKPLKPVLNDLAFRFSAGIAGNDAIPIYQSLSALSSSTSGYIFDNAIPVAYYPSRIENNRLTWEKTGSINLGVDFGFFKNRLTGSFEYYNTKTTDLLLTLQYPTHTGYPSRLANIGGTSNNGMELTMDFKNIQKKNFTWSTTLTIARNKQMVDDIGGFERVTAYSTTHGSFYPMYAYEQGRPLNALWGMQYAGTWKSQQEILDNQNTKEFASASPAYYVPGRQRYIDQNKDGVLDYDDLVYLGNADPEVYGGLQNSFNIYGLNVSFYFNYSIGGKLYNPIELFMGTGSRFTNQFKYMVDAWHPVRNPDSDIPYANSKDQIPNDRFVHSASFLRLKNASLSYRFDLNKLTKNRLNSITLFGSGNNLFLWKKYNGFDPEVSSVSEGSTIRRMDNGAYPNSRTIIFGAQVNF
ncbi:TonB-dependent receptor [Sphingobacterium lactis]|uniref:TonB-dependent receptor n=1 Tax=Sphingobacterium lactis TaxID=797291 RepID=UPI003F7D37E3